MSALSDPPSNWKTCTPSNVTNIAGCRGVYVGVGGNVAVRSTATGDVVTFVGVPTGQLVIGSFDRVMSTNTTATTMLLGY